MHYLQMSWTNYSKDNFSPTQIVVKNGTNPSFTPSTLPAGNGTTSNGGNCNVYTDQSHNLGNGPEGSYVWQFGTDSKNSVSCQYHHPSGTGTTSVTVTPNGSYQVSFNGSTWSSSTIVANPTGTNITQPIYIKSS
jgi:hypothetical protein